MQQVLQDDSNGGGSALVETSFISKATVSGRTSTTPDTACFQSKENIHTNYAAHGHSSSVRDNANNHPNAASAATSNNAHVGGATENMDRIH